MKLGFIVILFLPSAVLSGGIYDVAVNICSNDSSLFLFVCRAIIFI